MATSRPSIHDQLDYLSAGARPWLLLTLMCLGLYLPGIAALPPVDRDEARYIQASRQMLESGDYLDIRFQDEARNKKPAGIYWLQSLSVRLFSRADSSAVWPYRLVSVAGGLASTLLLFALGSAMFDRRSALIAAAGLGCSAGLCLEAHIATTDAVLLATAIAAEGTLGLAYLASRRGEKVPPWLAPCFWLAEIAALYIKGPVVLALTLLTAATLAIVDRRAQWLRLLRPLWGVSATVVAVAPWLWLIERHTGGAFLQESVGHDLVGKLAGAQEAHGALPGYYLLLAPVTFWPASFFLGLAAVWLWRTRRLPASRLLLAWIVPFWIVLELVRTKLPHYALPLYPALALAAARAILSIAENGMAQPRGLARYLTPTLWGLIAFATAAVLLIVPPLLHQAIAMPAVIPAAAVLAALWQMLHRDRWRIRVETAAVALFAGMISLVIAFGAVLPQLRPIWLSRSASELVQLERKPGDAVSSTGYAEPSLVFLLGTDTQLLAPEPAGEALASHRTALALVAAADEAAFRKVLNDRQAATDDLGSVSGLDYSTGKWLTLTLYRLRAPAA